MREPAGKSSCLSPTQHCSNHINWRSPFSRMAGQGCEGWEIHFNLSRIYKEFDPRHYLHPHLIPINTHCEA
jgi:hypothetical protein